MRRYLGNETLQSKIATFKKTQKPVGAICHGVLVLARSRDPESGKSVVERRRTTCLTKPMERTACFISFWKLGKYYRT